MDYFISASLRTLQGHMLSGSMHIRLFWAMLYLCWSLDWVVVILLHQLLWLWRISLGIVRQAWLHLRIIFFKLARYSIINQSLFIISWTR